MAVSTGRQADWDAAASCIAYAGCVSQPDIPQPRTRTPSPTAPADSSPAAPTTSAAQVERQGARLAASRRSATLHLPGQILFHGAA